MTGLCFIIHSMFSFLDLSEASLNVSSKFRVQMRVSRTIFRCAIHNKQVIPRQLRLFTKSSITLIYYHVDRNNNNTHHEELHRTYTAELAYISSSNGAFLLSALPELTLKTYKANA